ncbi:MAG: septal ring lytic transglycosylase RlpA family protein [Aeromonadaceae bacterium]
MQNKVTPSLLLLLVLAGCSTPPPATPPATSETGVAHPDLTGVGGVTPRFEPPSRIGNKDYVVFGQPYKVWNGIESYQEEGTASWYGPGFHGLYTSNGELYNQEDVSAAHKNLPLPSYLKVSNLDNGKVIVVRVNDRGPFHGDRILDLSHGAATQLGLVEPGTARVRVELVKVPPPPNAAEIIARHEARTIQLLATNSEMKAQNTAKALSKRFGHPVKVVKINEQIYRLHLGPLARAEAEQMLSTLRGSGYQQAFFVN